MTGAEHYREAERLLDVANNGTRDEWISDHRVELIAEAHVHATLAHTAATALAALPHIGGVCDAHRQAANEWHLAVTEAPDA